MVDMTPIAFAEREADLVRMTIMRTADGCIVARRRRADDVIVPTHQEGEYNDVWRHVRSGGLYVRHDKVLDLETNRLCFDYSAFSDGRLWLRDAREWDEIIEGRARFERA